MGANFPGPQFAALGAQFAGARFAGAQFSAPGALFAGARFTRAHFAAKNHKGPNLPRTISRMGKQHYTAPSNYEAGTFNPGNWITYDNTSINFTFQRPERHLIF